ncbi:MAG: hydantoinase/oxoprolinase family protein [Hyphomicrobiales bacterium]
MKAIIGWDIGGAHLKAARAENGRIVRAIQAPCPLWLGLDRLDAAFARARRRVGSAEHHHITMTGELADAFASRAEGVATLARLAACALNSGEISIYAGRAGFVGLDGLPDHVADIASANWHACAQWAVHSVRNGLFVDMGSTTTDLIPLREGRVATCGYSDAERLVAGELVYTGMVRTSLMAVTSQLPFRGRPTPLMNEHFASIADVHRILGELPAGADQQATADGREKTIAASRARLARMVGADAGEAPEAAWAELAGAFREAQLRSLHDAAMLVLSRVSLPPDAPIIGAGIGATMIRSLALRLRRSYLPFARLLPAASAKLAKAASDCAPAAALALLTDVAKPRRAALRKSRSA